MGAHVRSIEKFSLMALPRRYVALPAVDGYYIRAIRGYFPRLDRYMVVPAKLDDSWQLLLRTAVTANCLALRFWVIGQSGNLGVTGVSPPLRVGRARVCCASCGLLRFLADDSSLVQRPSCVSPSAIGSTDRLIGYQT
jgi:hypothetical protein